MLTKKKLPLLIALICGIELSIYFWSHWTSTLGLNNFFGIQPEFIFDKCARLAGRVSSALILLLLVMVGFLGLKKIYADEKKKESFLVLIILFTCNHLIHLFFVLLRFHRHSELLILNEPVQIGGTIHGVITFSSIVFIPFILWINKNLNKPIYFLIIFYLLNISSFIVKTFLGKIKPPEHPAYHNQLGVLLISSACLFIVFRVIQEYRLKTLN